MSKGIFITGTDTGVGKTFVACGLIEAMITMGLSVCPMKPVESGCGIKKGELIPEDTVHLIKTSGINEPLDLVNPYRLKHHLAPSVAAEIERVKINKKKILSSFKHLLKKYDVTIVEGAGGGMVPVYKKYLFLDLAKDLDIPVIIVSRPGLGTINHTLLTLEAARSRGLKILGVIFNYAEKTKRGLSEKTNPGVIKSLGDVTLLGEIPYSKIKDGSVKEKFRQTAEKILSGMK